MKSERLKELRKLQREAMEKQQEENIENDPVETEPEFIETEGN